MSNNIVKLEDKVKQKNNKETEVLSQDVLQKFAKDFSDKLSEAQVKTISELLEKSNTDKEIFQKIKDSEEEDLLEIADEDFNGFGINTEFDEKAMKELGLDDETIESLKDVYVCPEELNNVDIKNNDYLDVLKEYDIPENEVSILLEVIHRYKNNDNSIKYYEKLPDSVKRMADATRLSSPFKMTKESSAKFLLKNFISDAAFGRIVDNYNNDMADLMNNMHSDFQNIVHDSLNDMMANIDKIREENPEQAEKLEKFQNAYKEAISFNKQIDYLNKGVSLKKLNKWTNRFRDECFYFNKKVNSDENKTRGIKFIDIETLVPTIKNALTGFTELDIQRFIVVLIRSTMDMDMSDIINTYYMYSVVSSIDSFRFNIKFDSDFGKELFENIAKVIRKINSL